MLYDGSLYGGGAESPRRDVPPAEREIISRISRMPPMNPNGLRGMIANELGAPEATLGEDVDGRPVKWDPTGSNLVIAGGSGSGRTVLLRYMISQFIATPGIIASVYSGNRGEAEWIDRLHPVTTEHITDLGGDIIAIDRELSRRRDCCGTGPFHVDESHPRILLVIDGMDDRGREALQSYGVGDRLKGIIRDGHDYGIHVVITETTDEAGDENPVSEMVRGWIWTAALTGRAKLTRTSDLWPEHSRELDTMELPGRTGSGLGAVFRDPLESPEDGAHYLRFPYISEKRMRRDLEPYLWQLPEAFRNVKGRK